MTRRSMGLVVLGFGLIVGSVFAQEQPAGQPVRPQRQRGVRPGAPADGQRGPRRMTVDQQMERLTKELQLTADQQEKIRKLIADNRTKMMEQFQARAQESREKMRELQTQIEAARQANDTEKLKELDAKRHELFGGSQMAEARQKLISDIEAVLTPEQKKPFEKIQDELFGWGRGSAPLESDPNMLGRALRSLDLPQDKTEKVRELFKDWRTRSQSAQTADEKKTLAADLYKKVMEELTPEQQTKLKEWRGGSQRGGQRGHGPASGAIPAAPAAPQQ